MVSRLLLACCAGGCGLLRHSRGTGCLLRTSGLPSSGLYRRRAWPVTPHPQNGMPVTHQRASVVWPVAPAGIACCAASVERGACSAPTGVAGL